MTLPRRNDPCPCGSGRKYKKCCLVKAPAPAAPGTSAAMPAEDAAKRQLAERLRSEGRLTQAVLLFDELVRRHPRDPDLLFRFAEVHFQLQSHERAIELMEQACAERPRWTIALVALADALLAEGRAEDALARARAAIDVDGQARRAHLVAATCLNRLNRVEEAWAMVEAAPAHPEDAPERAVIRAEMLRRRGDLETARRELEDVIRREGLRSPVYNAWQELGLVLDKLGEHDAAFEAATRGGLGCAQAPRAANTNRDMWFERIDAYRAVLDRDLLARFAADELDGMGFTPAFLVGFPRSGTTMTEQIMAAHPDVTTSDERPFIQALCKEVCVRTHRGVVARGLAELSRDDVLELRAAYREKVEHRVNGPLGRVFVDKLPLNLMDIGVINVLFPEARVIVALRDPRDVCLSCFMQRFGLNAAMVNFLWWERTAAFYARVMDFWLWVRDVLTVEWITVRYEDTVRDLEGQARRILAHLGVAWDASVLSFHERARQRSLTTPSFVAVTEKVHTKAVGRWRAYERHYEPVRDVLAPFVEAFGYEPFEAG